MARSIHLTAAVICEDKGKILMVREADNGISCWNQPAGHVELEEDICQAAIRETLEETCYEVELTGLLGVYQGLHQITKEHYVRVCFTGQTAIRHPIASRDKDIEKVEWINLEDLLENKYPLRSLISKKCLEDFDKGTIYPIEMIKPLLNGALL